MKRFMASFFLLILLACANQITFASEEIRELKKILDISIQYNEGLLEILEQLPENPEQEIVSKALNHADILFQSAKQKTEQLSENLGDRKKHLSDLPEYKFLMGEYRKKTLLLMDNIRIESNRIKLQEKKKIGVIKHSFKNSKSLHEDTKKQILLLSDKIEERLLEAEIIINQINDKDSALSAIDKLIAISESYDYLSNLLYLYCKDDPETGEKLLQNIQQKYIAIYSRLKLGIDRLKREKYYHVLPLMQLLEAS